MKPGRDDRPEVGKQARGVPGPGNARRVALPAALLAFAVLLAGCGSGAQRSLGAAHATSDTQLRGLVPEPLPHLPDFTLTDTAGRPFNLTAAARGKLTYLYFGYTHCPNACPATMSDLSYAVRLQPAALRRRVEVVFVTVDPRRDTRPALRAWLDHYSADFVGLTGTPAEIAAAELAAGVPPAPPEPRGHGNYAVAHSSLLFAYSPDGRSHVVYSQGFRPADYAHDLPLLLRFGS